MSRWQGRKPRTRARDGWQFLSGSNDAGAESEVNCRHGNTGTRPSIIDATRRRVRRNDRRKEGSLWRPLLLRM